MPLRVHELHGDELGRPADPRAAVAVVAASGHDPADVGAVPVVVLSRSLPLDHVPAVGVVDVAVLVVVLAVVRLVVALVDVRREVGMVGVDPGVEDRHLGAARARRPGARRVDVVVLRAVDQRVVERVEGVVRRLLLRSLEDEVRLGVGDAVGAPEPLPERVRGLARARPHDRQPAAADATGEAAPDPAARRGEDVLLALLRHSLLEADQETPRHGRRGRARGRRDHERADACGRQRCPQEASSSRAMTLITAWISDRWVNACGKFPSCLPLAASISSA